jgi:hypothetical protein
MLRSEILLGIGDRRSKAMLRRAAGHRDIGEQELWNVE